ncbi:MAG: hypothetical protein ACLTDX_21190 [[Clostridium] innocuum]
MPVRFYRLTWWRSYRSIYRQDTFIFLLPERKKRWGERSGYRTELHLRNEGIRQRYVSGCTIDELSTQYALSHHAIKKIIYQK